MKSFRFESIYLLSREERKARAFSFHPKRNLVVGRNHTGKSTLIKNLFQAIGARPTGKLLKWNDQAITAVRFSLDGEVFQVVNQSNLRALFDEAGDLLFAASNHEEWSEKFSGVLGFNLVLTNKKGEPKVGDSRCFFLPFYVNQDGSLQSKWDTFVGMQQYKKPQSAILEYFTGIKPPKYYEINSQRELLKAALEDHLREMKLLIKTRNRVAQSISFSGPKLDPENFDDEVRQLSEEVTALNSLQERLRDTAVRQREAAAGTRLAVASVDRTGWDQFLALAEQCSKGPNSLWPDVPVHPWSRKISQDLRHDRNPCDRHVRPCCGIPPQGSENLHLDLVPIETNLRIGLCREGS
jgi:hypothetical protein